MVMCDAVCGSIGGVMVALVGVQGMMVLEW